MKKLFSILGLILMAFSANAQNITDQLAQLDSCVNRSNNAVRKDDHAEAEKQIKKSLKIFSLLPDTTRTRLDQQFGGNFTAQVHIALAANQSMQEKNRTALENLKMGVDLGYLELSHYNYSTLVNSPEFENIRSSKEYVAILDKAREEGDFGWILRQSGSYDSLAATDSLPAFKYANPNDRDLVRVRQHFNLDSIAGSGDELSKIKNLLLWVHNTVSHDGSSSNPKSKNAIDMVELCQSQGRGVNCRMMAQILNECYLAMGFKSRFIVCMPRKMINDCHVINVVYSNTLDKWVWADPTFNAYVTDENGVMLGIGEVRDRMRNGGQYFLNKEANWNNQVPQTKEEYLDVYMAKNLYYVVCPSRSEYNTETWYDGKRPIPYVALLPQGYDCDSKEQYQFITNNPKWFWASPYAE